MDYDDSNGAQNMCLPDPATAPVSSSSSGSADAGVASQPDAAPSGPSMMSMPEGAGVPGSIAAAQTDAASLYDDGNTLPLQCSDPAAGASVPCPTPNAGPMSDPDGQLPVIVPDAPEPLTVNGGPTPECSKTIGGRSITASGPNGSGTLTGPSASVDCSNGNGMAEVSAGKITAREGALTQEAEGPNARAGFRNSNGTLQAGAQANLGGASVSYDTPNTQVKGGLSAGLGLEGRVHLPPSCGVGADIGPFSFDIRSRSLCPR
jgi:hypothetical protein